MFSLFFLFVLLLVFVFCVLTLSIISEIGLFHNHACSYNYNMNCIGLMAAIIATLSVVLCSYCYCKRKPHADNKIKVYLLLTLLYRKIIHF